MESSDICRVCMDDDRENFKSLFEVTAKSNLTPAKMIADVAETQIEKDDGLPEVICSECLAAITEAHRIRSKCRNTDRKLRKILNFGIKNKPFIEPEFVEDSEMLLDNMIPTDMADEQWTDATISKNNDTVKIITTEENSQKDNHLEILSIQPVSFEHKDHGLEELTVPLIIKQEDTQHDSASLDEEYLVEEIKDLPGLLKHVQVIKAPVSSPKGKDLEEAVIMNSDELSNEEQQIDINFPKIEIEALDEEQYEDYEAIDEDLHSDLQQEDTRPLDDASCCGCPMDFSSRQELEEHSRVVHLPEKDDSVALKDCYTCDICYKKHISLKALEYHKSNRFNKKMRTCRLCNLVLQSARKRRQHEQLHKTLPEDFEIKCCGCDQAVLFKKLGIHAEKVHKISEKVSRSKFVCEVCYLDCGYKHRLEKHHSQRELSVLHKKNPKQLKLKRKFVAQTAHIDGKQRFICDICGKHFSTKGNLKSHRSLHVTAEKPFKCTICKKEFSKKSNYNVHQLRTHSTDSPFNCELCGKRFKCDVNLKNHLKVHSKQRPYLCSYCPKDFAHLSDKRRHEIGHSGNYPFRCELCNKPFTRRTALDRHRESCSKRFANQKRINPFQQLEEGVEDPNAKSSMLCDLCEELLPSIDDLAKHHAEKHIETLHEGSYEAEVEIE
ncbi:zinc finger protein 506-like [Wyeomyia smithii]|uniref:zinc finger protein 506-like n=1 Tax=Wyeomyia smithii TaxID=174621 RepID=UPI002467C0CE|nr:zinc finger protein 506-like [Wyeomyia smithii]